MTFFLTATQVIGTLFAAHDQPDKNSLDPLALILLLAGPIALAFRRRFPVQVLLATTGITLGYLLLDYPYGPIFFSLVASYVSAVVFGHRLIATTTLIVAYVSFHLLGSRLGVHDPLTLPQAFGGAAWLIGIMALTEMFRTRRERAIEASRTRSEEARRRASEERLRIARELHDVLAHNISLINVQAGVALHLMDDQPEQARTALSAIKQASQDALGELRSVLDILRLGGEEAPRAPTPGLADLDDLIQKSRAAGLEVSHHINGKAVALPPGIDRAAFRIVQEGLTNAVRHAGPARATVHISYRGDELIVAVEDDGRADSASTSLDGGKGIAGMRERAAALGGTLEAGPRPSGGFRVLARLPLRGLDAGSS